MNSILSKNNISRIVDRIAYGIVEKCIPPKEIAFIGLRTRGEHIANRIKKKVEDITSLQIPSGIMDITLYRDDLNKLESNPVVKETLINFDIHNKIIILVDDVLNTGRTIRAALDQIMDFGRPKSVKLVVLIDRGGRELPIQADFTGKKIDPVSENKKIEVRLIEIDNDEGVFLS